MQLHDGRPILLIEDNPRDAELTVRALKKNHVSNEVVVMRDGQTALEHLHGAGAFGDPGARVLPALILLDLKLPKIDGLEVLRRIRADPLTRLVPVILLTSSSEEQDKLRGYDLGANSYVRKPVSFTEFVEVVGALGVYWLKVNEPVGTQ